MDDGAAVELGVDGHAFLIDVLRDDRHAAAQQQFAHVGRAWFFHRAWGRRVGEELDQEVERVLRADRHQDFVGACLDAAAGEDFGADLFDQHAVIGLAAVG